MTARERAAGTVANYVDERTGAAKWLKKISPKSFLTTGHLCWVRLLFIHSLSCCFLEHSLPSGLIHPSAKSSTKVTTNR